MDDLQQHNISDAKAHLGQLVNAACDGESIAICRSGVPAVVLVPMQTYGRLMELLRQDVAARASGRSQ